MSKPTATELAGAGLPDEVMLTGASAAPPPVRTLRAGPVGVLFTGGDLRQVRLGEIELARRVYSDGSPDPAAFRSRPDRAYPLALVLADLCGLEGREIRQVAGVDPAVLTALAISGDSGTVVTIGNLTRDEHTPGSDCRARMPRPAQAASESASWTSTPSGERSWIRKASCAAARNEQSKEGPRP